MWKSTAHCLGYWSMTYRAEQSSLGPIVTSHVAGRRETRLIDEPNVGPKRRSTCFLYTHIIGRRSVNVAVLAPEILDLHHCW